MTSVRQLDCDLLDQAARTVLIGLSFPHVGQQTAHTFLGWSAPSRFVPLIWVWSLNGTIYIQPSKQTN